MKEETSHSLGSRVEARSPQFSSAVAHKPYPVALLEEYLQITQGICNRARNNALTRKIASAGAADLLDERCKDIGQ